VFDRFKVFVMDVTSSKRMRNVSRVKNLSAEMGTVDTWARGIGCRSLCADKCYFD
jgi:hypothetical protein